MNSTAKDFSPFLHNPTTLPPPPLKSYNTGLLHPCPDNTGLITLLLISYNIGIIFLPHNTGLNTPPTPPSLELIHSQHVELGPWLPPFVSCLPFEHSLSPPGVWRSVEFCGFLPPSSPSPGPSTPRVPAWSLRCTAVWPSSWTESAPFPWFINSTIRIICFQEIKLSWCETYQLICRMLTVDTVRSSAQLIFSS